MATTRANSTAGLNDELQLVLEALALPDTASVDLSAITVLDCGGGTGRLAVPLAQLGASVTVVDISGDALAALSRRATEAGVADRVQAIQGDVETLPDATGSATFDLVVLHGVLDAVDASATLAGVRAALRPGGLASILVTNPAAGLLAKVLAGDLEGAVNDLRGWAGADRLDGAEVAERCERVHLDVLRISGVGVFTELIPTGAPGGVTSAGNSVADLAGQLEELSRGLTPFREIASRLHVLARRPPDANS